MKGKLYEFSVADITGKTISLNTFRNKVLLIVNTASFCGFTPQYSELEELYKRFQPSGFEILAFPCDQFNQQEPGSNTEIMEFCHSKYGITFPLFSKIKVNGQDTDPLYKFLKSEARGLLGTKRIKWNFTKFLIDKKGNIISRYAPYVRPPSIEPAIQKLL